MVYFSLRPLLLVLLLAYASLATAADHFPPYKTIEVGIRSYLLVLGDIRLTERQSHSYLITQEGEPPSFERQRFGIHLEKENWPIEDSIRIASKIDRTVITVRIFDARTNALLFEYKGPIFRRDNEAKADDHGLTSGAWAPKAARRGLSYGRTLDTRNQYRLDYYYKIFGVETPFRKKIPQRIEFSVVEPMANDVSFDGTVMVVIEGGIGK